MQDHKPLVLGLLIKALHKAAIVLLALEPHKGVTALLILELHKVVTVTARPHQLLSQIYKGQLKCLLTLLDIYHLQLVVVAVELQTMAVFLSILVPGKSQVQAVYRQ